MDSALQNYSDPQNVTWNDTLATSALTGHVNAAFMLLFFVIGLPWNALVIGIILKKKLFTRPSVMLLLNLAINHFLVCISIMPITFLLGIDRERVQKEHDKICQTGILFILFPSVSIHTVALMSVDRVIYLKKPLTYGRIVTPWRMFFAIVVVWIFSITLSLLPIVGVGQIGFDPELATCGVIIRVNGPYFILLTVFGALSHFVKLVSCGCIVYIIRKHLLRKLRRGRGPRSDHKPTVDNGEGANGTINGGAAAYEKGVLRNYKKSQLQLLKVFGAIFAVSILTLLPFAAAGILVPIFGEASAVPLLYVYRITYILVLSKSVIYPILESYMTRETRDTFFGSACCIRNPNHTKRNKNEGGGGLAIEGVGSTPSLLNISCEAHTSQDTRNSMTCA